MLKLFKQYKYLVFCSLSGIILSQFKGVSLFGPPGIWRGQLIVTLDLSVAYSPYGENAATSRSAFSIV